MWLKRLLNSEQRATAILFVFSLIYYCAYNPAVLLQANSVLSSVTGDGLKNYYTFAYHITNDEGWLTFTGMNYPFGEHVIYTDCQPILTWILRLLPFTHAWLIGILHWCLVVSYPVAAVFVFKTMGKLHVPAAAAFIASFAVVMLAPSYAKIVAGHFALAHGWVLPAGIYLLVTALIHASPRRLFRLALYELCIFFLHPYLAFGLSLLAVLAFTAALAIRSFTWRKAAAGIGSSFVPPLLFQAFMKLTDHHANRPTMPYGTDALVENVQSLLTPEFGWLEGPLAKLLPGRTVHFEGHSYLGLATVLGTLLFIGFAVFRFRALRVSAPGTALLCASAVLLFLSFGWHIRALQAMHISVPALNQFRAVCRFAWFFYFALPIFLLSALYRTITDPKSQRTLMYALVVMLISNIVEAHGYLTKDSSAFWKFRNIFSAGQLTDSERSLIAHSNKYQCLIPLPLYMVGSEMYNRTGDDRSLYPSVLISYHARLPVVSTWLSRTSISETASGINLLNCYRKESIHLPNKPILAMNSGAPLMEDEARLWKKCEVVDSLEQATFGSVTYDRLRACDLNSPIHLSGDTTTASIVARYQSAGQRFGGKLKDYTIIYLSKVDALLPGRYVCSFWFDVKEMAYPAVAGHFIVASRCGNDYQWQYVFPVSEMSGFYDGFNVIERRIEIEAGCTYEFMVKGDTDRLFSASHFLLRPEDQDVVVKSGNVITTNNFPP